MRREFPSAWKRYLDENVKLYERLNPEDRAELKQKVMVFLEEKHFEGCRGFKITDEVRVTIAANACLLLLRRKTGFFPSLVTILVYPSAFMVDHVEVNELGIEERGRVTNLGESWDRGNVILAWDSAKRGALDPRDGLNVVIHEFAHQLDAEATGIDGAPPLTRARQKEWARVFQREYDRLIEDIEEDRDTVLDDYAATNPAEFFAVAVETFFEKPHQLRKHHPELYEQLGTYFNQDPAESSGGPSEPET